MGSGEPFTRVEANRLASQLLYAGAIRFSGHALAEMAKDALIKADAVNSIRHGTTDRATMQIDGTTATNLPAATSPSCVVPVRRSHARRAGRADRVADQEATMSTHPDTCFNCGHKMRTRRENVPFLGLPGVVLVGVPVSRCPSCGEYEVAIPNIDELHRVLALRVIEESGRLTSAEIRFLRTVLDYTSAEFARLIGASPVTISRWEHGVQPIGHHADALVRALVLLRVGVGLGRAQIEKLARAAAPARRPRAGKPIALRSAANKWKPTALRAA